jgi:hypothetical protein
MPRTKQKPIQLGEPLVIVKTCLTAHIADWAPLISRGCTIEFMLCGRAYVLHIQYSVLPFIPSGKITGNENDIWKEQHYALALRTYLLANRTILDETGLMYHGMDTNCSKFSLCCNSRRETSTSASIVQVPLRIARIVLSDVISPFIHFSQPTVPKCCRS